jgi:hypothetical protein
VVRRAVTLDAQQVLPGPLGVSDREIDAVAAATDLQVLRALGPGSRHVDLVVGERGEHAQLAARPRHGHVQSALASVAVERICSAVAANRRLTSKQFPSSCSTARAAVLAR